MYHIPVLLKESVEGLNIQPNGCYVDLTYGGGGHSKVILEALGKEGKLIAFDQDEDSKAQLIEDERLIFVPQNFRYLKKYLKYHGVREVDGILGDLGVSSKMLDTPARGFSTRFEGPLDMRMSANNELTAAIVVNTYEQKTLEDIFYLYGDLRQSRKLAKAIIERRKVKRIDTIDDLKNTLLPFVGKWQHKGFARIFQALRIEVNKEIDVLKEVLVQATQCLKIQGRLSIISYHSLEDRIVKNYIKTGSFSGTPEKDIYGNFEKPLRPINKKIIVPTAEEISLNSRARSAKLRVAEKI